MKKSNSTQMVEILRQLKPEMNGAVVGEMEKLGVKYNLSYGVAIPVIRRVAAQYAPDHALAAYLFRQDIRELKLAAFYLDDPGAVTRQQMEQWMAAISTAEMTEHAAMALFYAAPEAEATAEAWLFHEEARYLRGALQMIGRRAATGLSDEESMLRQLTGIEILILNQREVPVRPTVYALCQMARTRMLQVAVGQTLTHFEQSSLPLALEIAEEVKALTDL